MENNQIEIATSFCRKISLSNYGGPQYESEDIFVSMKQIIIVDKDSKLTSKQQVDKATQTLNKICQDNAESLLRERINLLKL